MHSRSTPSIAQPGTDELTIYLMTAETPRWADAPGIRCVALSSDSPMDMVGTEGPSLVVLEAALLNTPDPDWVKAIQASLGRVVVVGANVSETSGARKSGVNATFPDSLLQVPDDLAVSMLHELAAEPPSNSVTTASLEQFMRDAIHEFRTPLTVVIEFASLCDEGIGGTLSERHEDYVRHVLKAAGRLSEHFDDYRDAIRMQLGTSVLTEGESNLADLVETALRNREMPAEFECPNEYEAVDAMHGPLLTKAVERVLSAALKWRRTDAPIDVEVRQNSDGSNASEVRIGFCGLEPGETDIAVIKEGFRECDHGLHRSVARVFGLGVAMSRLFLESIGGSLHLESRKGSGGVYVLTVPTLSSTELAEAA